MTPSKEDKHFAGEGNGFWQRTPTFKILKFRKFWKRSPAIRNCEKLISGYAVARRGSRGRRESGQEMRPRRRILQAANESVRVVVKEKALHSNNFPDKDNTAACVTKGKRLE